MTARRKYSDSTENTRKPYFELCLGPLFPVKIVLIAYMSLLCFVHPSQAALVDRSVAVIGDKILTYREAQINYMVGRLSDGMRVELYRDEMDEKELKAAVDGSIREILVLKYLARIALKKDIQRQEVESRIAAVKKSVKDFDRFLRYYEIDLKTLENEITDKLNVDYFFEKARGIVESVSDREIMDYYEKEKDNKFYGKSFGELRDYIKRYLVKRKIARRNDEWIREQMEKNRVRILG